MKTQMNYGWAINQEKTKYIEINAQKAKEIRIKM